MQLLFLWKFTANKNIYIFVKGQSNKNAFVALFQCVQNDVTRVPEYQGVTCWSQITVRRDG